MNWIIKIDLHKDRMKTGKLALEIDGETKLETICLGIADRGAAMSLGNPTADPLHKNGNTPCGVYHGVWIDLDPLRFPAHSYGAAGAIQLTPVEGDCLIAAANGRDGLLIHSGDLQIDPTKNPFALTAEGLRCTHGCIRDKPDAMAVLKSILQGAGVGTVEVKEANGN